MAGFLSTEIKGFDELNKFFDDIDEEVVQKGRARAVKAGAKKALEGIQRRAPRAEHAGLHMADDIKIRVKIGDFGEAEADIVAGKKRGWKWHFLEYGTSKMAARPFIRPTLDEDGESILKAMEDAGLGSMVKL